MRKIYFAAVVFFCGSMSYAADPTTIPSNHPILGIWKWTTPIAGCSELYNFKANNRFGFSSGAELGESRYTIAAEPSAKGFYRLENTIIKDNGLGDCRGLISEVGAKSILFLRFNPKATELKMCPSESEDGCFGPLKRE